MDQQHLSDGSVVITLSTEGDPETYRFRVMDLYGENEQLLEHQVIRPDSRPWLKQRMDQAKRQRGKDDGK